VTKGNDTGKQWQISGQFDGGASGSPVISTGGALVGLVFGNYQGTNISYVVPLNYFATFFQTAGLELKGCADSPGLANKLVEQWSEWREGGYNQDAWCNDVRQSFERTLQKPVRWTVLSKDERSKEEFPRRFYYQYFCKGQAEWQNE
jgi:hypothetical protein